MASAPDDPQIVTGRIDAEGRLVAADPPLAALQHSHQPGEHRVDPLIFVMA